MSFWNFYFQFRKSCLRQYFIVTLDKNPHLRKAGAYFNSFGSISSKKFLISIFSAILLKHAQTPFKLWWPNMSCLHPIRTSFSSCVHAWMKMTVCEQYELDTSGIRVKRKKPYIKVLTDFVKLCSCGKIMKYVSCNRMMRKSAYFSHGTCINLVKHVDHIALVK